MQDPSVDCENCTQQISFSKYNDHIRECIGGETWGTSLSINQDSDSQFQPSLPQISLPSTSTVTQRYLGDTPSSPTDVRPCSSAPEASVHTTDPACAQAETNIEQLVDLTGLPHNVCYVFLHKCHDGNFEDAVDVFTRDGQLSVLIAVLATNLDGNTKYIKISSCSESFSAAIAYFKGPEYNARRPLAIQAGLAIDAGGPLRQFLQDVFDVAMSGDCLKLFDGNPHRVVPVNSSMTMMSGALEIVGKMIVHSIIQGGPSFPCLSPAIYWFIVTGSLDSAMQHATINDAITPGVRYVINKVSLNRKQLSEYMS